MMRPPTQVRPRRGFGAPSNGPAGPTRYGTRDSARARRGTSDALSRPRPSPRPSERPASTRSSEEGQDGLSAGSERPVGGQRPTERPSEEDQRVSVCVRVRPMSEAEVSDGFTQVINCDLDHPGTIQVLRPPGPSESRKQETYTFDTVLPSSAGQAAVYNLIGSPIFDRLADGYNSCIIAFGATGCGKSHTIFGLNPKQERGLVPRISESLFKAFSNVGKQTLVKVSYLELYNEKARDLLKPDGVENGQAASLEVREHPKAGVFVEGLTRSAVSSSEDVLRLVDFGHKIRVVRSTHMNAHSSRSHAIVTLHLQQALNEPGSRQIMRHSQLHAVDLAGAERLFMVGEDTLRRRESMQINKSLLALGQMISKISKGMAGSFVPYRNSKLTFLLADSLMGNCQTAMIACISPSSSYQQLTESTLRFATSVKEIKTKPVQNEEPTGDLVQALRAEVAMLRRRLRQGSYDQSQAREMEAQLRGDEYLQEELSANIAEMQARAKTAEGLRRRTLRQLGLRKSEAKNGIFLQKISSDPLLSGCLTWTMSPGDELRIGSDPDCEILVDGLGVEATMCHLHCLDASTIQVLPGDAKQLSEDEDGRDGLHRKGSLFKRGSGIVMVNSIVLKEPQVLQSGDFLRVGRTHFFRAVGTDALSADRAEDARVMDAAIGIDVAKDAQHLRDRFGVEKADEVIRDLKELKLVVEEANELTVELRGLDEVSFKGRLLMDPLESEEPSVVVSKIERPEGSEERSHLAATWTLADFQLRLEVMRDIYDEVRHRDLPWGQPGDLDPWQARDHIPVITSTRDTPRSSYAGSPLRHSRENTPRAIPCPEASLTTTLSAPHGTRESATAEAMPSNVAALLQQLPHLQAELAKAHQAQGQQASELSSVRRELEELRLSLTLQKSTTRFFGPTWWPGPTASPERPSLSYLPALYW
ncbi:unnamed protein product [Durusdinium trenchii]|uniref:Kinesin motor domain-containing protein n=1 Tax=Durusdinium trenchii TaxID=1381693 RepID=A0ABP0P1V5_9DINO